MKMIFSAALAAFLMLAAIPAHAQSQADLNNAARESDRIQREQQLQQQSDINHSLESARPPTHIETPPVRTPTGHGSGCHNISKVVVEGATHFPDSQKKMVATYEGHCLGVDEIQKLLGGITNYYVGKGYVTTRVYLPAQDLSTGTLRINVIEGVVDEIRLKDGDHNSLYIPSAFPFVVGSTLNLRDFEQGLDQINRLASNNATLDIEPGEKVGDSVVVIKNDQSKRWHVNASVDDYGDHTTGRNEMAVTGGIDDVLGLNDYFSLSQRKTTPLNDFNHQASSTNGLFSVPVGYSTVTLGYSGSDYDTSLIAPSGANEHLNGTTRAAFATLDNTIYRDQTSKAILSFTLTRKSANNYAFGQLLGVSSRTLTVLDTGLSYNTVFLGGSTNMQFVYSGGLAVLGPQKDPDNLPPDFPRAQFHKISLDLGWVRPFKVYNQDLTFSTQWTSQYAFDPLYSSEQLSVGGIYTVRGFYHETLANDNGFYARNDLTLHHSLNSVLGYNTSINPYLALDTGAVGSRRVDGSQAGTLVGTAAGFKLTMGPYGLDFYGGVPLAAPKAVMDHEGFDMFGQLSVNF